MPKDKKRCTMTTYNAKRDYAHAQTLYIKAFVQVIQFGGKYLAKMPIAKNCKIGYNIIVNYYALYVQERFRRRTL